MVAVLPLPGDQIGQGADAGAAGEAVGPLADAGHDPVRAGIVAADVALGGVFEHAVGGLPDPFPERLGRAFAEQGADAGEILAGEVDAARESRRLLGAGRRDGGDGGARFATFAAGGARAPEQQPVQVALQLAAVGAVELVGRLGEVEAHGIEDARVLGQGNLDLLEGPGAGAVGHGRAPRAVDLELHAEESGRVVGGADVQRAVAGQRHVEAPLERAAVAQPFALLHPERAPRPERAQPALAGNPAPEVAGARPPVHPVDDRLVLVDGDRGPGGGQFQAVEHEPGWREAGLGLLEAQAPGVPPGGGPILGGGPEAPLGQLEPGPPGPVHREGQRELLAGRDLDAGEGRRFGMEPEGQRAEAVEVHLRVPRQGGRLRRPGEGRSADLREARLGPFGQALR